MPVHLSRPREPTLPLLAMQVSSGWKHLVQSPRGGKVAGVFFWAVHLTAELAPTVPRNREEPVRTMCLPKSPKMPAPVAPPPPPPDPQEAKPTDMNSVRRRQNSASTPIAGGTLLTGPSGIENSQLSLTRGGGSLLGG